jgi:hypothetical protein
MLALSHAHRQITKPFRTDLFWIWKEVSPIRAEVSDLALFSASMDPTERYSLGGRSRRKPCFAKSPAQCFYGSAGRDTQECHSQSLRFYFMFTPGSALIAKATLVTL